MKYILSLPIAVICTTASTSAAFVFVPHQQKHQSILNRNTDFALLAGFGAGSSKASKKSKAPKMTPLKPKQQWDRFGDFAKISKSHEVGVKVIREDIADGEWLSVGYVNVKDDADDVTLAVSRQRSLIAEHAKRLHPLSVLAKDKIEWGYSDANGEWQAVASISEYPKNFEKKIGFEGIGDPASGYYCHYKDGKVVALNTRET